ncbi:MAG: hypothetical protein CMJ37_02615 [Phycisphaerae bacterium]|nr:hypothetical protein [Phycisphaerae bacterium]
MLASLTGLLLTLGGDQPAVVFDPPLDPAIFNWDGRTLSVKEEHLPLDMDFSGPPTPPYDQFHRVIISKLVNLRAPSGGFFDQSIEDYSRSRFNAWCCSGDDGENLAQERTTLYAGQILFIQRISSNSTYPVIEFIPDESAEVSALQARVKALEQALESCQCASDLDGDGSVGFTDLVELISVWGPCSA